MEIDFEKSIERELKGLVFFFTHWVLASVRPDRARTPTNKDAESRYKVGMRSQIGNGFKEAGTAQEAAQTFANTRVFLIYGHDATARDQLEAMLRRWGLDPLILDQLPSEGRTIIEKLGSYTDQVGFAVVLATPDD